MQIRVVTCNRPAENYAHHVAETIGDIRYEWWNGSAHCPQLAGLGAAPVMMPTVAELKELPGWPVIRRAVWNYWRAMEGEGDLLLLEDDVRLADGWAAALGSARAAVAGRRCVLSLYLPQLPQEPEAVGPGVVLVPHREWASTAAVLYPASVRGELRDFLKAECVDVESGGKIWDWALRDYMEQAGIETAVMVPNVVQHVGRVSTIGDYMHSSPTFTGRA